MTKLLPTIYGLSIDNIKQKINFYKSLDLEFIVLNDTKNLMQSVKLSYARLMFYKDRNIEISELNYIKLFVDQKRFEKQYEISKEEILKMYNYDEYLKNMQTSK